MKAGIFSTSTGLRMGSFASTLLSIFLTIMALSASLRADDEPVPLTPDFTAVVVKGGGLWPQLHTAPDGALLAFGYNAPSHTTLPGDVDCWASTDGGRTWLLRATAAARPHQTANYCHWASGLTEQGQLFVLASGMDDAANEQGQRKPNAVRVFCSGDSGKTWAAKGEFPVHLPGGLKPYPFGSIVTGSDHTLRTLVYTVDEDRKNAEAAWMMTSRDDGRSWGNPVKVADSINESVLVSLGGKSWLCLARTTEKAPPELGQELRQFRSADDGQTWADEGLKAGYHQHPPHLLRLQDNRLVLTYGNRRNGGIEARLSSDEGQTWAPPLRLFTTGPGDMGYPSTAQLSDGLLVTVFYASKSPLHDGYHMGAVGWSTPRTKKEAHPAIEQ